jgi:hypothetical protein
LVIAGSATLSTLEGAAAPFFRHQVHSGSF